MREVVTEIGERVVLAEQAFIAPLQRAAPGVRVCSHFDRLRDDGLVVAWPHPPFTLPDPKRYVDAVELGREPASLTHVDTSGVQSVGGGHGERRGAVARDGRGVGHRHGAAVGA